LLQIYSLKPIRTKLQNKTKHNKERKLLKIRTIYILMGFINLYINGVYKA